MGNRPDETVVGVPALERPSLRIVGNDHDDDENDVRPVVLQAKFTPVAVAKERGGMEEEDDAEEEDEAEGGQIEIPLHHILLNPVQYLIV
jgi:hypothetical protein